MEIDTFTLEIINRTRDWIEEIRHLPPGTVDFHFDFDDEKDCYVAQFDFGRKGYGSMHTAIFSAIGNALEAIEIDVRHRL